MKQAYPLLLIIIILFFSSCSKSDPNDPAKEDSVRNLTNLSNIEYASNKDTSGNMVSLTMDVYFPKNATTAKKYPLVMMIHGGSYINGDKSEVAADCSILADSGFVVAAVNYRLGWRTGNGTCQGDTASQLLAGYRALQDANAAMRYLVSEAKHLGIDPNWIFIAGNSAGSSLALNTTYISDQIAQLFLPSAYALLGPINNAGNSITNTFKIRGVCNMWGAVPDSNLITPLSAVPTISFHGTNDHVVPYDIGYNESCTNYLKLYGSACIHRRLVQYQVPVISNFVIGGEHAPSVYTHQFLMGNTACFFNRVIRGVPITSKVYTTLVSSCE